MNTSLYRQYKQSMESSYYKEESDMYNVYSEVEELLKIHYHTKELKTTLHIYELGDNLYVVYAAKNIFYYDRTAKKFI